MAKSNAKLDKHFEKAPIIDRGTLCGIEGCCNNASARGVCALHYARITRGVSGERLLASRHEKNILCLVEGCQKLPVALGYCSMHRNRVRRHGSVEGRIRRGRVGEHPLYNTWRRLVASGDASVEWQAFWLFVDAVGERPSRRHMLSRLNNFQPFGPSNFEWKLPVKLAFDVDDPSLYQNYIKSRRPMYEHRAFLKRYRMSDDQYRELLEKQGGLCAICNEPETTIRYGKVVSLSLDHDHKTKKVRGLLCVNCNKMLGHAHDDIEKLQRAIQYLKGSSDASV